MIKIGAIDGWEKSRNEQRCSSLRVFLLEALDKYGVKYELVNCLEQEADLVLCGVFPWHRLSEIKGNPIKLFYSGESTRRKDLMIDNIKECDLSMSFFDDSDTNLYLPLWMINYNDYFNNRLNITKNVSDKIGFCSFIVSHCCDEYDGSKLRGEVFHKLCEDYKKVYSMGGYENNMGFNLPRDFSQAQQLHKNVKFNLCFENNSSEPGESYITEKIINAYTYGTVPIYFGGGDNLLEYFNKDSFINCNGKSLDEIIDIIKYYDTHDYEYEKMLNAQPFNDMTINYNEYRKDLTYKFLKEHNVI